MKRRMLAAAIWGLGTSAWAHVPVILPPLDESPVATYFISRSEVSRAVYSELSRPGATVAAHFQVKPGEPSTLISLLTPVCADFPGYEAFQPRAFLLKGEVPWKNQGESDTAYLERLKRLAVATVASNFAAGSRPKFFEEFGKREYWVGGEWRGRLKPGLYSIVVHDPAAGKGTFVLGLNEKEAWTPDLFKMAAEVVRRIDAAICSPGGFTGRLGLTAK